MAYQKLNLPNGTVLTEDHLEYIESGIEGAYSNADAAVAAHNASTEAHQDIRIVLQQLADRINAVLDSDDTTLDELNEIVAYIKSNKSLIDAITISKVNVSDVVNNLTSNVADKPLSAAQGMALKALIDAIKVPSKLSDLSSDSTHRVVTDEEKAAWNAKLSANRLPEAVENALAQAKESGEFDGADGRGIVSIVRTAGNGAAGTTDTYTITYTDNTTSQISVYNGKNGTDGANPLLGKKVSFLGDSICAGSSESTSYLGGYGKIIADRNGMVYENVARAGATVTAETYSRSTGSAKPWLCRMVANMSGDADYAIIEGGINDGWDETVKAKIGSITKGYDATLDDTTYYGAFESMLKQLVTKFKGKKIGYIAVPKIMGLYDSNRNAPNFYHIALECCAKWGVPVCDLNTIIPPTEYLKTLGAEYSADGTHPTYEGYLKYYCDPIEAWMKTLTTGASVSAGTAVSLPDLDDKYVSKNDVQIKKAKLTLEDGTTVLIDVVVASAGTTIQKYLNLIPTSIASDGSIYNGVGYKHNTRLSSTGAEKSETSGTVATGFIPAVGGDDVYLGGAKPWYVTDRNNNYLCAYDSNFNFVGAVYNSVGGYYYTKNIAEAHELGDTCKITLASGMNIAYIRASWPSNTGDVGADLIVTVNQEIV